MASLEDCTKILKYLAVKQDKTLEEFMEQNLAEINEAQKLMDEANVQGLTFEEREATHSAYLDGALHIRIGNLPSIVYKQLLEAECESVNEDAPRVWANCIQKTPLALELFERLKQAYELPLGPLNPGMRLDEMYHILMLLDVYWD